MGKIEAINITNISEEDTFYVNHAILEKADGHNGFLILQNT